MCLAARPLGHRSLVFLAHIPLGLVWLDDGPPLLPHHTPGGKRPADDTESVQDWTGRRTCTRYHHVLRASSVGTMLTGWEEGTGMSLYSTRAIRPDRTADRTAYIQYGTVRYHTVHVWMALARRLVPNASLPFLSLAPEARPDIKEWAR
jgi:hypothetical protein